MVYVHPDDTDVGPPVIKVTRPAQPPPTRAEQIQAEAGELLAKADAAGAHDRRLARGYRERARKLLDQLNPSDRIESTTDTR